MHRGTVARALEEKGEENEREEEEEEEEEEEYIPKRIFHKIFH